MTVVNNELVELFKAYRKVAGSPEAAATLVLAHLQADQKPHDPADAMSVRQVAQRLGVSKETVYRLCEEHTLPHSRIGRRITISTRQLDEYQSQPGYEH